MKQKDQGRRLPDFLIFILIMGAAWALSMGLARIDNDNNPFAMAVFILAVALTARVTEGYFWGIAASLAGTFCVNYFFTYPFWSFDITYPGYPLTVIVMLIVSVLISALTTQIKKQEQLRFEIEREKMHANLLRAIAHDLRTPLSAILGASSSLQEQKLSPQDQKALAAGIERDARWLVRVTENLLSVTRFSGGEICLKKDDEVLEEIIGSAVVKYHRTPGSLPVKVEAPKEPVVVQADGVLLEQVLINLFDNVSDHAAGATQIWLTVICVPGKVQVQVEDDGRGIPPAELPHLFDGGTRKNTSPGSDTRRNMGIGLAVCSSVIRAHGGEMNAGQSKAHGGARFDFWLPGGEEKNDSDSAL